MLPNERRKRLHDGTKIAVRFVSGGGGGQGRDYALPNEFTMTAEGGPLPWPVEMAVAVVDGVPSCRRLTATAGPAGEVTLAGLRLVAVERLLREGTLLARQQVTSVKGGWRVSARPPNDAPSAVTRGPGRPGVTRDRLAEVADAWSWANGRYSAGVSTRAAERLGISRSQLNRLLPLAVEAGLLTEADVARRGGGGRGR